MALVSATLSNEVFANDRTTADSNLTILNPADPTSAATIRLALSEPRSVGLPNNAGTGFIWTAKVKDESLATVAKTNSIAANKDLNAVVGYRTIDVFVLTAHSIGITTINFRLERPGGKLRYDIDIILEVDSDRGVK